MLACAAAELGRRSAGCAAAATIRRTRSSSAPAGSRARPPASLRRRQLDGHQERRLRRGPADPLDQRPRHPRHHRRPAAARREVSASRTSSSALPLNRYHDARRVFDVLSQTLVEVRLVADVPDLAGLSLTTTQPRRPAGDRPARKPALRPERRRQAGHGHRAVADRAGAAVAAAAADRRAGEADQPGPDLLPPGALRAERPSRSRCSSSAACASTPSSRPGAVWAREGRSAADPARRRSCARPASTSCRSSSTCCWAT